jgi:hypothetical protein
MLRMMPRSHQPRGVLSDTRVAAALVNLSGPGVLSRLPGRWVVFGPDATSLHGDWQEWRGMQASNLHFAHQLRSADPLHQPLLPLTGMCGTPDT